MTTGGLTVGLCTTGVTEAATGPRDAKKVHASSHSRRLQEAQGCCRSQRSLALLHGSQLRRFLGRLWGIPLRVEAGLLLARTDILGWRDGSGLSRVGRLLRGIIGRRSADIIYGRSKFMR